VYIPAGFKDNSVNKKEKKKTEAEVDGSCRKVLPSGDYRCIA